MKNLTIIPLAIASAIFISGCAVTTAGVKKGDERNFARSVNDVSAGRAIKARMTRAYDFDLDKIDVEVAEGIAVLTGSAPTDKDRLEAERIAWSGPNIVQVGNEVTLNSKSGLIRSSKDTFLSTAVKTRMIAEKKIKARNVNIETHNGVVYLMGVARDKEELERMTYIASTTDGAKQVVSYIKIAGQPVTSNASFSSAPRSLSTPQSFGTSPYGSVPALPSPGLPSAPLSAPQMLDPNVPRLPAPSAPSLRALPEGLSATPEAALGVQPYYRDPHTGERVSLPPGTKTIPFDPSTAAGLADGPKVGDAPYYINPSNGEKVQIVWTGE